MHIWVSQITHMDTSSRSHTHTHTHTHTHAHTSRQSRGWRQCQALQHTAWMSHVAHINESCHKYKWVMSHIWINKDNRMISSATCMNASCHTYISRVTNLGIPIPPYQTHTSLHLLEHIWTKKERKTRQVTNFDICSPTNWNTHWQNTATPQIESRTLTFLVHPTATHTATHTATTYVELRTLPSLTKPNGSAATWAAPALKCRKICQKRLTQWPKKTPMYIKRSLQNETWESELPKTIFRKYRLLLTYLSWT